MGSPRIIRFSNTDIIVDDYRTTEGNIPIKIQYRRYFQHAHFLPIVGVGKRGEY